MDQPNDDRQHFQYCGTCRCTKPHKSTDTGMKCVECQAREAADVPHPRW